MDQDFLNTYEPTCQTLSKFGWFVAPYMLHREFIEIKMLCTAFDHEINPDAPKKKEYQNKLNILINDAVFHPNYRAFFIYRSKQTPHLKEYSHLYERSIYHYYKKDFSSVVFLLLPIIEGVLLSHFGWQFGSGSRKPKRLTNLINKFKNDTINSGNPDTDRVFQIFGRVLAEFLEKWIFIDHTLADLSVSFLNRHILAHGMLPANVNTQADASRLIIFFDLFISYFTLPNWAIFIPTGIKQIDARRDYFFKILEDHVPLKECIETEENFLRENKNYQPPEHAYDPLEAALRDQKRIEEIRKLQRRV